jgi:rhamnulose-1-phosphate aldolase/alcohol dehydrogenase
MPSQKNSDLEDLLRISRAIGADSHLVLWGGGNSSLKSTAKDFRGRLRPVLYVKGSGSDMKTLQESDLSLLDLEAIVELKERRSMTDTEMVSYLAASQIRPGPRPSIETLLHAFLPAKFVLHSHADASAALVDNPYSKRHVEACWNGRVPLLPYQRPGFALSKACWQIFEKARRGDPSLQGIMLDKHGLITFGETAQEAYQRMTLLVGQAQRYLQSRRRKTRLRARPLKLDLEKFLGTLRGALSQSQRQILHIDRSPEAIAFSLREDAARLCAGGPATPDHLLYTKPRALFIEDLSKLGREVTKYRKWYDGYFKRYARGELTKLDSAPRIIVLRGAAVVSTGKDPRTARIAGDIFRHSMIVRSAAKGLGGYRAIGLKDICEFEYWPLENYKLSLAPPEKEMSRRIAVVTGAARGIGKAIALRLAKEAACVALIDVDAKAVEALARELGDRGLAIACDISDENAVEKAFEKVLLKWGGLDLLVSNAGLARSSPVASMDLKDWEASFRVNARGHFLCSRQAARIFQAQGLGGSMVFVSSKNVLAPGKDFAAYSASKAAQTQLAKVLALELAPHQVRVNCVMPDGVFEDSRLWDAIRQSRAKAHGIRPSELEDFYVQRNLLKSQVRPIDVAEAVLYLASERASKTTGALLAVDGGVKEAFPR